MPCSDCNYRDDIIAQLKAALDDKDQQLSDANAKLAKQKLQSKAKFAQLKHHILENIVEKEGPQSQKIVENLLTKLDESENQLSQCRDELDTLKSIAARKDQESKEKDEKIEVLESSLKHLDETRETNSSSTDVHRDHHHRRDRDRRVRSDVTSEEDETDGDDDEDLRQRFGQMYAQMVYKDSKIVDLNELILHRDQKILDLQESCRERDEVIWAKTKAVQVFQEKLNFYANREFRDVATETTSSGHELDVSSGPGRAVAFYHAGGAAAVRSGDDDASSLTTETTNKLDMSTSISEKFGELADALKNSSSNDNASLIEQIAALQARISTMESSYYRQQQQQTEQPKKKREKKVTFNFGEQERAQELAETTEKLHQMEQICSDLRDENDDLRLTIGDLEQQLASTTENAVDPDKFIDLETRLAEAHESIRSLKSSEREKEEELRSTKARLNTEHSSQIRQLRVELENDRTSALSDKDDELRRRSETIESLENRLLHLELENSELIRQRDAILSDVDDLREAIESSQQLIANVENELSTSQTEVDETRLAGENQKRESIDRISALERELSNQKLSAKAYETKFKSVEKENQRLSDLLEAQKREWLSLKTEGKDEVTGFRLKAKAYEAKFRILQDDNVRLEKLIAELKSMLDTIQAEKTELSKEYESKLDGFEREAKENLLLIERTMMEQKTEIDLLKSELSSEARLKTKAYEAKWRSIERENERLLKEKDDLETNEVRKLRESIERMESENVDLRRRLDEVSSKNDKEYSNLLDELSDVQSTNSKLRSELDSRRESIDRVKTTADQLREEKSELESDVQRLWDEEKVLKKRLVELERENEKYKSETAVLTNRSATAERDEKKLFDLTSAHELLKNDYQKLKEKVEFFEAAASSRSNSLIAELENAKSTLDTCRSEKLIVDRELADSKQRELDLLDDMKAAKRHETELAENLRSIKEEYGRLEQRSIAVEEENRSIEEQNRLLTTESRLVKTENESIKVAMESIKMELESIKTSCQSLSAEMESILAENQSLKSENVSIKMELDSIRMGDQSIVAHSHSIAGENQSLRIELDAVRMELRTVQDEYEANKTSNLSIAMENQSIMEKNQSLAMELQSVQTANQSAMEECRSLTSANQSLMVETQSIQEECQSIRTENQSISAALRSVEEENRSLKDENRSIKEEIGRMRDASRNRREVSIEQQHQNRSAPLVEIDINDQAQHRPSTEFLTDQSHPAAAQQIDLSTDQIVSVSQQPVQPPYDDWENRRQSLEMENERARADSEKERHGLCAEIIALNEKLAISDLMCENLKNDLENLLEENEHLKSVSTNLPPTEREERNHDDGSFFEQNESPPTDRSTPITSNTVDNHNAELIIGELERRNGEIQESYQQLLVYYTELQSSYAGIYQEYENFRNKPLTFDAETEMDDGEFARSSREIGTITEETVVVEDNPTSSKNKAQSTELIKLKAKLRKQEKSMQALEAKNRYLQEEIAKLETQIATSSTTESINEKESSPIDSIKKSDGDNESMRSKTVLSSAAVPDDTKSQSDRSIISDHESSAMEHRLTLAESESRGLQQHINVLVDQLEKEKSKFVQLTQRCEKSESEFTNSERKLNESTEMVGLLREELVQLKKLLMQTDAEKRETVEKVSKMEDDEKELRRKLDERTSIWNSLRESQATIESDVEKLRDEKSQLESRISSIETERDRALEKCRRLLISMDELETTNRDLTERNREISEENSRTKSNFDELESKTTELEFLSAIKEENSLLKHRLQDIDSLMKGFQERAEILESNLAKSELENSTLKREKSEQEHRWTERIETISTESKRMEEDNAFLKSILDELEAKNEELRHESDEVAEKNRELESMRDLIQYHKALEENFHRESERNSVLESELETVKASIIVEKEKFDREVGEKNSELDRLRREMEEKRSEYADHGRKLDEIRSENRTIEEENRSIREELERIRREESKSLEKIDALEREVSKIEADLTAAQSRLSQVQRELDEKSKSLETLSTDMEKKLSEEKSILEENIGNERSSMEAQHAEKIAALSIESTNLRDELSTSKQDCDLIRGLYEKLYEAFGNLSTELARSKVQAEETSAHQQREIEIVQEDSEKLRREHEALLGEKARLEEKFDQTRHEMDEVRGRLDAAVRENEELRSNVDESRRNFAVEKSALEIELQEIRRENERLEELRRTNEVSINDSKNLDDELEKIRSEFENERELFCREKEQIDRELENFRRRNEQLEHERNEANRQVDQFKKSIVDVETRNAELLDRLKSKDDEIGEVAEKNRSLKMEMDGLSKMRMEFERERSDMQLEMENRIRSDFEKEKSTLEDSKLDLKNRELALEKERSDVERHKSELDRRKTELDRQKSDLDRQKPELDRQKSDLINQKLDLENQKSALENRRSSMESQNSVFLEQIADLEREVSQLRSSLEREKSTAANVDRSWKLTAERLSKFEAAFSNLGIDTSENLESVYGFLEKTIREREVFEREKMDLERKMETVQVRSSAIDSDREQQTHDFRQRINQLERENADYRRKAESIENERSDSARKIDDLENSKSDLSTRIEVSKIENAELRGRLSKFEEESSAFRRKFDAISLENTDYRRELESISVENRQWKSKFDQVSQENSSINYQYDQLRREITDSMNAEFENRLKEVSAGKDFEYSRLNENYLRLQSESNRAMEILAEKEREYERIGQLLSAKEFETSQLRENFVAELSQWKDQATRIQREKDDASKFLEQERPKYLEAMRSLGETREQLAYKDRQVESAYLKMAELDVWKEKSMETDSILERMKEEKRDLSTELEQTRRQMDGWREEIDHLKSTVQTYAMENENLKIQVKNSAMSVNNNAPSLEEVVIVQKQHQSSEIDVDRKAMDSLKTDNEKLKDQLKISEYKNSVLTSRCRELESLRHQQGEIDDQQGSESELLDVENMGELGDTISLMPPSRSNDRSLQLRRETLGPLTADRSALKSAQLWIRSKLR